MLFFLVPLANIPFLHKADIGPDTLAFLLVFSFRCFFAADSAIRRPSFLLLHLPARRNVQCWASFFTAMRFTFPFALFPCYAIAPAIFHLSGRAAFSY